MAGLIDSIPVWVPVVFLAPGLLFLFAVVAYTGFTRRSDDGRPR